MIDDKLKLAAKIETRVKERDKMAIELQTLVDEFAKKLNKFTEHDLKTYQMLNNPDCLYDYSPIGVRTVCHQLKDYMIKKDIDFLGYVLDGKSTVKLFTDRMTDASKWILRFTKEPDVKKSGIEAIL